jgi:hypothetical protein
MGDAEASYPLSNAEIAVNCLKYPIALNTAAARCSVTVSAFLMPRREFVGALKALRNTAFEESP